MKKFVSILVLALACVSSVAQAQKTGETKNPPKPSETDQKVKPPVCAYVCTAYDKDGNCTSQEYRCD